MEYIKQTKPRNDNECWTINYLWMRRYPLENKRNGENNKNCPQICNCCHMHVKRKNRSEYCLTSDRCKQNVDIQDVVDTATMFNYLSG